MRALLKEILQNPRAMVYAILVHVVLAAVLRHRPKTPIMVRGDTKVEYGKVVVAMALLQKAGAPSVGLITKVPENIK